MSSLGTARIPSATPLNVHSGPLVYVGTTESVLGYSGNNRSNDPPVCELYDVPNAVGADTKRNMIAAVGDAITVFEGPKPCGPKAGSFKDKFGTPVDVASADARAGAIVVANIADDNGKPGSISVCTLSGGCTKNLTNANMHYVGAVALGNAGDCWASAENSKGHATLTFFKDCTGAGTAATGFKNASDGGLDIDTHGNLVSVDTTANQLYIYKGCDPACTLVAGPFTLHYGEAFFGHLDQAATHFAACNFEASEVDVYGYSPAGIKYEYSFSNGLPSYTIGGIAEIAYSPRSNE